MDAAGWIEAGGLVPPDAALPPDLVTDTVDARGYRHPGLPDRTVVRLVPDAIAMGVDTEMELLGFALADHHDDIARQRHRTLGFPGWALVNDPKRARTALEAMKAFRVEAKRALSKPGHAKDGFQAIADGLARTVPHFLPSFWEQAGRAFVDAGNPKMAATMFDKARTAEREFGLPIDEQVRADAFLEFALAGAITVKSLQGWAKELAASEGPAKAYDRFYALTVRRTLGGLPPWAGVGKDLRGLAKAAKRDVGAEDERFVVEVLAAPSLDRAPASFWDDYGPAVVRAARRDPALGKLALERFPSGGGSRWSGVEASFVDTWLDLLHEAGVLSSLWEGEPRVDRGAWLGRAIEWAPRGYGPLLQLARAMTPALLARQAPLQLGDEDGWTRLDVDLADLIVELGVPLAQTDSLHLDLGNWGEGEPVPERWGLPGEHRPRDPVHLVAHPELGLRLVGAVGDEMGETAFEAASRDSKALATARRDWLSQQIDRISGQGVPSADRAIEVLAEKTTAGTFAPWPELRARLEQADLAAALAASLQVGLADELGWPEWDAAKEELGLELTIGGPLPFTVLASSRRAIVLGPDGARVTAVDLKLKKDEEVRAVAWIDGHLLLAWQNDEYETVGRWLPGSGEPFATAVPYWENVVRIGIPAPGGGVGCGGPPVRPGDGRWPEARFVYTDGSAAWVLQEGEVHRLDPATGAAGAAERPAWLAPVKPMWLDDCALYPAPVSSPLGTQDGLYGWRVRGDDELVYEALDGRCIDHSVGDDDRPQALATWPGDPRPRPLYRERWGEEGVHVCSPDGWLASVQSEEQGLPLSRWHWLRPRDPAASAVLRTFPVERARALLDACRPNVETGEDCTPAVAPLLPEVTDLRLRTAIGALALRAAAAEAKLQDLLSDRADEAGDGTVSGLTTSDAREALGVLMASGWGDDELGDAIRTGFRFLQTGEGGSRVRWTEVDWPSWYGSARALGWAAARVGSTPAHRRTVQQLFRTWAEAGGCAPMHLRRATWSFDRIDSPLLRTKVEDGERSLQEHWTVNEEAFGEGTGGASPPAIEFGEGTGGASPPAIEFRALVWTDDCWSDEGPFTVETLEWSATGTFPEHVGATRSAERRWSAPDVDPAWIERMIAAIELHGERIPTDDEVELVAARTGLGRGAAVLLLAGAPNMGQWNKDFLGKEIRTALGLKVAEASAGKDALQPLTPEDWLAVLGAAMPDDPAELWGPEAPARLADAWLARFGARVAIPDEVKLQADKELPDAAALTVLAAPEADPRLRSDGVYEIDADGDVVFQGDGAAFDGALGQDLAMLVPWAFGALPVGDPLRANLPRVVTAAQARIAHPGFAVSGGRWWPDDERRVGTLMDAVGGTITTTGEGDEQVERHDTGAVVVVRSEGSLNVAVRLARMDAAGWALLEMLRGGLGEADYDEDLSAPLRTLGAAGFRAFAERVASTPVPVGGWEQDPAASAPELVAEVAKSRKLPADAARLYLQTLALHQPTKKNVQKWNGWTGKVYDAAAAALVEAELLLEAKRPRAGRDHFLPGAWLDRKGPDLPLERWKVPLYGGTEAKHAVRFPLPVIVPLEPFHRLFEAAWERVRRGDAPKFG